MFSMFANKKETAVKEIAPEQINDNTKAAEQDLEALATALGEIVKGQYKTFSCADEELHGVLKKFASTLSETQKTQLIRSVNLSMSVNEAVFAGAEMSRGASEINERSNGMAAAVQELTASVEQIASSTEQVAEEAGSMQEISRKGMDLSLSAASQMKEVSSAVSQTVDKLNSLTEASKEIAAVVGFISDIADQTNLLALNATIEAARAGEAGKGFAVVANEVKELANKTSQNAQQIIEKVKTLQLETNAINTTIEAVVRAVDSGEAAIKSSNQEMENVLQAASKITQQSQNVAEILSEQKMATNEVAEGVNLVASMTTENMKKIDVTLNAMDSAEKVLVEQLQGFVGQEIEALTVYLAKSDHIIWKKRLANMLVGRDSLNPDELADHTSCRLGKWYYAITDAKYKNHPAYAKLEEPHQKVHYHGIEAAKKYRDKDLQGAIAQVKLAEEASVDVIKYLNELLEA
ncbi:MAG: CZB domain-containing protein [Alphaproteobacteria bacterium]|nr:CZB domain-containing protein [Alphaproteobacteria bacterium]